MGWPSREESAQQGAGERRVVVYHSCQYIAGKPIHVASALELECDEFITTNGQVQKLTNKPGLVDIGLKFIRASRTGHLPDHYRQSNMLADESKNDDTITELPREADED